VLHQVEQHSGGGLSPGMHAAIGRQPRLG
jgi:hypothetical protein